MLISLCTPCHGRAADLAATMDARIETANASPPVEIVILDYASPDDVYSVWEANLNKPLEGGNTLVYRRYDGRSYYHMAHAWNLAVKASSGAYVAIMGADANPRRRYVSEARKLIAAGCEWMRGEYYKGIVIVKRDLFYAVRGYDERMEWYGREDKDLEMRLERTGAKFGLMPRRLAGTLRTPDSEKLRHYRLPLSKREMAARNKAIWMDNERRGVIAVNPDGWGRWDA